MLHHVLVSFMCASGFYGHVGEPSLLVRLTLLTACFFGLSRLDVIGYSSCIRITLDQMNHQCTAGHACIVSPALPQRSFLEFAVCSFGTD